MTKGRAGSSCSERRRYIKLIGQVSAMSILGPGENSGKKGTGQEDPRATLGCFGKEKMLYPAGNQAPVPRPSTSQYQSLQ